MGSETFSDFLIPLKFNLDEPSKKKFDAALAETEKKFSEIGDKASESANKLATAVKDISNNLFGLAYSAERVGASSEELKALGNAAERVGIGAEPAKSSLSAFFAFVNFEGGASAIKQWFNIDFDPLHPLKAMLDSAVKLADEYATGIVPRRQTAIREAERAGIPQTFLTTPGAARRLRDEMEKDKAFTGGALDPIAEKAKRLNADFYQIGQHLKTIGELVIGGSFQDAFSNILETVDGWLKRHKDDIVWFSNKAAEISVMIADKSKEIFTKYARITAELWNQYGITQKIHATLKGIGEVLQSFWDGSIIGKINSALEWAFQPFKWLWDKLQSLGLVGPSAFIGGGGTVGFGPGEGTESGGHGSARRGRFGHGVVSGSNLSQPHWWTPARQKYIYDKLRAGGLSDMGAKGLVARWMYVESAGGPGSVNPTSGAVGLPQWLGNRKQGTTSSTSVDDQIAHVLREIESSESAAGKLLKDAKTPWEGARAATAFERAEHYEKAGHGPHEDDWTDKTQEGIERVEKAISGVGKATTDQSIIPGQSDPHKPGFDPSSVKFHDYFPEKHSSRFPLGHRQFANNEHHDNRSVTSNIAVNVAGADPIDRTAHPLERTKNAALIRNTTATAS